MEDYGKVRVQQSEKCHGCGSLYNLYLNFIRGKKKKKEQTDGIQKALFSHQNNQKIHYYI